MMQSYHIFAALHTHIAPAVPFTYSPSLVADSDCHGLQPTHSCSSAVMRVPIQKAFMLPVIGQRAGWQTGALHKTMWARLVYVCLHAWLWLHLLELGKKASAKCQQWRKDLASIYIAIKQCVHLKLCERRAGSFFEKCLTDTHCTVFSLRESSTTPRCQQPPQSTQNSFIMFSLVECCKKKKKFCDVKYVHSYFLDWQLNQMSSLVLFFFIISIGRAVGFMLLIKTLVVQILAPTVHMLKCPWARHWTLNGCSEGVDQRYTNVVSFVCRCVYHLHYLSDTVLKQFYFCSHDNWKKKSLTLFPFPLTIVHQKHHGIKWVLSLQKFCSSHLSTESLEVNSRKPTTALSQRC